MNPEQTAEEFAAYILQNKPYLVEIENEIQKVGQFGELEVKLVVHRGTVRTVVFYTGRKWAPEDKFDALKNP